MTDGTQARITRAAENELCCLCRLERDGSGESQKWRAEEWEMAHWPSLKAGATNLAYLFSTPFRLFEITTASIFDISHCNLADNSEAKSAAHSASYRYSSVATLRLPFPTCSTTFRPESEPTLSTCPWSCLSELSQVQQDRQFH